MGRNLNGLREDIVALVVEHSGVKPEKVDPADVLGSTRMKGDVADAFFESYAARFKINLGGFLDYFHYAGNEPRGSRAHLPVDAKGKIIPY